MNNGYDFTIRGTTYQFTKSHDLSQSTPESRLASGKHSETHIGNIYYLKEVPKLVGKHNSKTLVTSRELSCVGMDCRNSCYGRGSIVPNHLIFCGTPAIRYGHRQRYKALGSS
jgi:hypothetical protein